MRLHLLAFCSAVSLGAPLRAEGWPPPTRDLVPSMQSARPGGARNFAPKFEKKSPACGVGCRVSNWLRYAAVRSAAEMKPVTQEELRAAFLSTSGIEAVKELFEDAVRENIPVRLTVPVPQVQAEIAEGPIIRSVVLIPETGGEVSLSNQGKIVFHRIPDGTRPLMRLMATYVSNVEGLSALYREWKPEMEIIDGMRSGHILMNLLELIASGHTARLSPFLRAVQLQRTVLTVLENGADSYLINEYEKLDAVSQLEWAGRYVGRWHIHTPQILSTGWHEGPTSHPYAKNAGLEPTPTDLNLLPVDGQSIEGRGLTIIFFPDGFDVFDLFTGKKNPYSRKVVSYRSAAWKSHFREVHARLKAQLGM